MQHLRSTGISGFGSARRPDPPERRGYGPRADEGCGGRRGPSEYNPGGEWLSRRGRVRSERFSRVWGAWELAWERGILGTRPCYCLLMVILKEAKPLWYFILVPHHIWKPAVEKWCEICIRLVWGLGLGWVGLWKNVWKFTTVISWYKWVFKLLFFFFLVIDSNLKSLLKLFFHPLVTICYLGFFWKYYVHSNSFF